METLKILRNENFTFSKRYGQNFLTDEILLADIANDASLTKNDTVLEIGAGAGTLTKQLAKKAKRVVAFEIDKRLEPVLAKTLENEENVDLIFDDVTKWNEKQIEDMVGTEYKVVANLPYYITTPLLFQFIESKLPPKSLTVMVQKEVAERICATEKKGDYGALSVSVALRGEARITRIVTRDKFMPPPNVDSAVVRIDLSLDAQYQNSKVIFDLVKNAFMMKRKTLVNNLSQAYKKSKEEIIELLLSNGLSQSVRAEQLSKKQFIELANAIAQKKWD